MKEYVIPVILVLATVIAISAVAVITIALLGNGIKIGDMTYYLSQRTKFNFTSTGGCMKINSTVVVIVLIVAAFVAGYVVSEMFARQPLSQIQYA